MSDTSALERRVERLEQLVVELLRKLKAAEAKAGRVEQKIGFLRSVNGS